MNYLKNKTAGFYLSWAAAILTLAGIVFYKQASRNVQYIGLLMCTVIVLQVAATIAMAVVKECKWMNLILTANAVLMAVALVNSFFTQVDMLGYVVSGLYGFETIQAFVTAVIFMFASWIIYVVASYIGFEKKIIL